MRRTVVFAIVAAIILVFSFFAIMQTQQQSIVTSATAQTQISTPSGTSTQSSKSSMVGQISGWLIEVRYYDIESLTNKTVEIAREKYYYWNGILYKYDNGIYWKMGRVDTLVVKNFTKSERLVGGYRVTQVTFLPYNGGPPPINDTVVKAHFQALYTKDRTYGYNITIEIQYSQLLATLHAICREPGNKVVMLPFTNITIDYRVISISETNMLKMEKVAIASVGNGCSINPKAVEIEK